MSVQLDSFRVPGVLAVAVAAGVLAASDIGRAQNDFEVIHAFTGEAGGSEPAAALIQVGDSFYRTTSRGGDGCFGRCGTIFTLLPDGAFTISHSFISTDGANPMAPLLQAIDGNFYGTTSRGGTGCDTEGCGAVFQMTTGGTVTVVHAFTGPGGLGSRAALIQASDGLLYGTAESGGNFQHGVVFRLTLPQTTRVLR